MSVLTAARIPHQPTGQQPAEVTHTNLTDEQQQRFENAMHDAYQATTPDTYAAHMARAIDACGINPGSGEIIRCGCCIACDQIYDAADRDARTYWDGTHYIPQCPGCADDHPGRDAE